MGELHARERNVPHNAANGSSEQNPRDPATESDRPIASDSECPAEEVASAAEEIAPAADLPFVACSLGAHLIVVNHMRTPADGRAEVVIHEDVADVLPAIVEVCRRHSAR